MLNLENIAANEVGLTEEMMTENSGRGIAEVALTALATDPAIRVRLGSASQTGTAISSGSSDGMVVVLAGNNKSGARAIAGARHLSNKGVNVVVCVVGAEREQNLLEDMKQQVRIYRNFGGRVFSKHEFFEQLRKATSDSAAPPVISLVVDALLGLTVTFEELRTGDQAAVYELMEWANRNEAFVLAVDVPTGIDPSSGRINLIDGAHLYVKPRWVVALGAPKRGLVEALTAAHEAEADGGIARMESAEDEWKLYVADMGLGASVWKRAGTRMRKGVNFEDQWVLEMQWQGPASDAGEADPHGGG
jgi:enhancer of mRNA-decapping protein 3